MTRTLDLFAPSGIDSGPSRNLLPRDGEVYDHGCVFPHDEAAAVFSALRETVAWQHDELVIAGKRLVTARQVAWYGDREEAYHYSGSTKVALPWTPLLASVKARVEGAVGNTFNACLLNLYMSGDEGMSWHSDDEGALGPEPTIASLSFGAMRRFDLRHKRDRTKVSVELREGQLIVMTGATQHHWEHSLPKTKKVRTPRINLTFRTILDAGVSAPGRAPARPT